MTQFTGEYYKILYASYGVTIAIWWVTFSRLRTRLYPGEAGSDELTRSWKGLIILVIAGALTLMMGRLYSAGLLIPPYSMGKIRLSETGNQLLIYSPFILYAYLQVRKRRSILLPAHKWHARLLVGLVLSLVSVIVFTMLTGKRTLTAVLSDVYNVKNLHFAAQIFFEDLLIAMLLASFNLAIGRRGTAIGVIAVSFMFAYGHLPSRLDDGVVLTTALFDLTLDAMLGIGICIAIMRSKDFLWFWPIHFAMDMMQFYSR